MYPFAGLPLFIVETAPKIQNNLKFTKEQEMFANWTTDTLCAGMEILAWFLLEGKYYSHT